MNIDEKIDMLSFIEKYCVVKLPNGETAPVVLNDAGKGLLKELEDKKEAEIRRMMIKDTSVTSKATFEIKHY